MEKIKKLILLNVPISTCNLRCKYCYITLRNQWNSKVPRFNHTPEEIGLAFSKERLGGTCFINICGSGETLIPPYMIDIIESILEQGHFVEVVTNGTLTKRFDKIVKLSPNLLERLTFKFSFHYLELKRLNKLEIFFQNIEKIKNAGCSFSAEMTPCDELEPYIESIKKICMKHLGALCHLTIARNDLIKSIPLLTNHSDKDYMEIWNQFNSDMFNFKKRIFQEKREEFCYAGDWSAYINLITGEITKCYHSARIGNIYNNIDKPIEYKAVGKCRIAYCFNGHALLTLGVIPSLSAPTYAEMRNRKCINGSEWLSPVMKKFMSGKLIKNNNTYSNIEKIEAIMKNNKEILISKLEKRMSSIKKLIIK
jgi:MoaA/NifB/PqqE/SkfB family radical SAM enzyme